MRKIIIALILLAIVQSGCSLSSTPSETSTPQPAVPTLTQTALSTPPTLTPGPTITETPIPSPTLEFTEVIFSLDIHGPFVNKTDGYTHSKVDSFTVDEEIIISLQIRGLEFPSEDASNGLVIDNGETGTNRRSIAFVYQDSEWRIFEHNSQTDGLDLIWINRSLPPDLECTLHFSNDGKTLELILPGGREYLTLGSPLWIAGDRLTTYIQIAPKSSFEIVKLMRLALPTQLESPNSNGNPVSPTTQTPQPLKDLADSIDLEIGSLLMPDEYQASEIIVREFNLGIASFGWKGQNQIQSQYDFNWTDWQVSGAEENGMTIRLQHIIFPADSPAWLRSGSFTKDELTNLLKSHVSTLITHYKGQIDQYVIVNEPYLYPYRVDDIFYKTIGKEYIEIAFRAAREADPDAVLIYNDSDNHSSSGITTNLTMEIVQRLKANDLIDGVGLQMHLDGSNPPDKEDVIATMRRYGLPVYVTEFDVNMKDVHGTEDDRFAIQAKIYSDMLEACLESGVCRSFSFWGIGDNISWIETMPGYQHYSTKGDPTMYDDYLVPKPAYYSILDTLLDWAHHIPEGN